MEVFEIITVTEFYGNDFSSQRKAIYLGKGRVRYLPDPEPEEIEENESESEPT
jgi:hypothetical protein